MIHAVNLYLLTVYLILKLLNYNITKLISQKRSA